MGVVEKILSFVSEGNDFTSKLVVIPPVFTLDYRVERVDHTIEDQIADDQKILNNLFEAAGKLIKPPTVYNINNLFCALWRSWIRHGGNNVYFPEALLETALQTKLEEDMYAYECTSPDSCHFHGSLEGYTDHYIVKYCSLSISKRYVYTICSFLTENICINTECIPGRHKPTPEDSILHKESRDDLKMKTALSMAVLKEYTNPFSGVEVPRGGSMNGTTFLPKDKDPAVAIMEQIKLKMHRMKTEEDELIKLASKAEELKIDNFNYCSKNVIESVKNSDNSNSNNRRPRRLWARFEEGDSAKTENLTGTMYHSYM